jgi:2-hydroxycyclohexanecarboxyl-CoA dehydrogenase
MFRLQDKVAIVIGAGSGIGRGTAKVLAREGAAVVIAGPRVHECERVVNEVEQGGGRALAVVCDPNCRAEVEDVIQRTLGAFGPPDVLVNSVEGGGGGAHLLDDVPDDVFMAAFRRGVLSSLHGMQAVFPHMKERGGNIVNLALSTGMVAEPGSSPNGTAAEAVRGLTQHAAREWGRYGIRVNLVTPAALGDGAGRFRHVAPQRWNDTIAEIPLGRLGDPTEDIGQGILAIVTDLQYLTGATLALDGGRSVPG